jgi:hypothetical protein
METITQTTEQKSISAQEMAQELEQKYQSIMPGTKIEFWQIDRENDSINVFYKQPSRLQKMMFFDHMQTSQNSLAAQNFLKSIIIPENHPDVLDAIEPNGRNENDILTFTMIMKANEMVSIYFNALKKK